MPTKWLRTYNRKSATYASWLVFPFGCQEHTHDSKNPQASHLYNSQNKCQFVMFRFKTYYRATVPPQIKWKGKQKHPPSTHRPPTDRPATSLSSHLPPPPPCVFFTQFGCVDFVFFLQPARLIPGWRRWRKNPCGMRGTGISACEPLGWWANCVLIPKDHNTDTMVSAKREHCETANCQTDVALIDCFHHPLALSSIPVTKMIIIAAPIISDS